MPRILTSLIQSDFGTGTHGNFEAVILQGDRLVHWWRDNSDPALPWKRGQIVVQQGAAAAGSIIQSDVGNGAYGNFEVVVPLFAADGTTELWHFRHDNSNLNLPWQRGQRIATNVAGAGCIIQSDLGSGAYGNFEVVVPVMAAGGTNDLWHYRHDNSDLTRPWQRGQRVAANVAGPGTLIQRGFRSSSHGNFEVVVPLYDADGRRELWHYRHDNADAALPWQQVRRVAENVTGPGVLIQSDFRAGTHGNFEVVVPIGASLAHFWRDNSDVNLPWRRGQIITEVATGWGCLIQSSLGSGGHGNFEVLAEEGRASVVAYWHPNQDVTLPWMRGDVVTGEPYPDKVATGTRKVAQLTGEYDREGWNGQGRPAFALNRTESRFGIRGCDLGVSFEHKHRLYFLFGDTWRLNQTPADQDLDGIAYCTDSDPSNGLRLTFSQQPPLLPGIDQHGFNVPLDGVSRNGSLYAFFSTDAYQIDGRFLMGRSVLGRSDNDGDDYVYLGELSRHKFINVSVVQDTINEAAAGMLSLAIGTPVLWLWGSGRYRASAVYLALLPLTGLDTLNGVRYFAGDGNWSSDEQDAARLFGAGDVGELSVRWNPFLARWLLLFNSGNPRGILLHSALRPWGPWSEQPVMVFDPSALVNPADPCSGAGHGRFMHSAWNVRTCDHLQDDMFNPGQFRDNEWGAEYGAYQITRYASGVTGQWSQIWFTMSTWNPYQSVLMTARISSEITGP